MADRVGPKRIVVVGSYNAGLTVWIRRLPALGETVLASDYRAGAGGKGSNQAIGAARLGGSVALIASVGSDSVGDDAIRYLEAAGVDTTHVRRSASAATGVAFILVDENADNAIVVASGANAQLDVDDVDRSEPLIAQAHVVLAQWEIETATVARSLLLARSHGAITIFNPAPARDIPDGLLSNVDILTPNESEARTLLGLDQSSALDVPAAGRSLLALGPQTVVITQGAAGATVITDDTVQHVQPYSVLSVDPTGAGDAFNAALAIALAEGRDLVEAVDFACASGAFAVTRAEVLPGLPTRAQLASIAKTSSRTES